MPNPPAAGGSPSRRPVQRRGFKREVGLTRPQSAQPVRPAPQNHEALKPLQPRAKRARSSGGTGPPPSREKERSSGLTPAGSRGGMGASLPQPHLPADSVPLEDAFPCPPPSQHRAPSLHLAPLRSARCAPKDFTAAQRTPRTLMAHLNLCADIFHITFYRVSFLPGQLFSSTGRVQARLGRGARPGADPQSRKVSCAGEKESVEESE